SGVGEHAIHGARDDGFHSSSTRGTTARWKPSKVGAGARRSGCGQCLLKHGAAPSTLSVAPEMNAAAGDNRKTIAAAISASVARRPSGTLSFKPRRKPRISGG